MFMNTSRRIVVPLFAAVVSLHLTGVSQTSSKTSQAESSPRATNHFLLTATVINKKGDFVTGLQKDNFRVFFDNEPVNITDFSEADLPLSVGILFDASASVINAGSPRDFLNAFQQALRALLHSSNKSNEYFLLAFNNSPQLLLDWTADPNALADALNFVRPKGNTAVYDACYLAIDKLQHGRYSKRALILISDGEDNVSSYSFNQLREALRESDVLLYTVNFSDRNGAGSSLGMEGQLILKELSSISGGMFFSTKGAPLRIKDATSVFEVIASELAHQYSVEIQPQFSNVDNKWHKIKIRAESPPNARGETKRLQARTRDGFYLNHR